MYSKWSLLLDADMSKIKSGFISNFAAYFFRVKNVEFVVVGYQAHVPAIKQIIKLDN